MVAVVILAGGEGRRIGGAKPLVRLGEATLLNHALRLAGGWSSRVAIAVDAAGTAGDASVAVLHDTLGMGPIAGLHSALSFAATHGESEVLTIPCDTPFLPPDLHKRLAAALGSSGRSAIAASGGRRHPVCGLWRTSDAAALRSYIASGRSSLHGYAGVIGAVEVEWRTDSGDPFLNINSLADLADAEAWLRERGPL